LDGFLTVPSSSSSLKIYTHFLEILSSEYFRTCLNCYVLSATLLVHDPIAPCLDYGNRLLVSSLLVCSNCYLPYATILRVLNDFLKVWSGADSHWWPLRSTIHRFRLVYTTKYITLPKHTLFQTGYFPHYYYHSLGILSYMTLTKPIFSVKINPSTHPSMHTYIHSSVHSVSTLLSSCFMSISCMEPRDQRFKKMYFFLQGFHSLMVDLDTWGQYKSHFTNLNMQDSHVISFRIISLQSFWDFGFKWL